MENSLMSERRDAGASIVVTGASGGIGLAIAKRMVERGWNVIATDVHDGPSDALAELVSARSRVDYFAMDVRDEPVVADLMARCAARSGGIAALANVAGILQNATPLFESDLATQRQLWDVNYFGAVTCTKIVAEHMARTGGGAIVNITSINEMRPLPLYAYAPAKAALGAFTQISAGELAACNIRVNAISPGFTLTPLFENKIARGERDPQMLTSHTAMGRLVAPHEIASAFEFLVSDQASAITGVSLPVDAGWLATSHWMSFRDDMKMKTGAV